MLHFHRRAPLAFVAAAAAATLLASSASKADPSYTIGIAPTRAAGLIYGTTRAVDGGFNYRSATAGTTFLAKYTFDSGPSCVDDGWTSVDLTAGTNDFGDFAAPYYGLSTLQRDPCEFNHTCVWTFFSGSSDDYACGGYPAHPAVPFGSAVDGYIHNEIWSPAIALEGRGSALEMRFDVYRELDLNDLVFYTWRVRSITSGVAGEWSEHGTLYYGQSAVHKGDWYQHTISFGDLIEPGADSLQVALGVADMCGRWCGFLGDGACHSHAPLFDNVVVWRVDTAGPQWHVEPVDLFQDNFAADGTATGTVRVDIARDINPRATAAVRPGDSVVVWVGEPNAGLDYHDTGVPSSGPAVYLHVGDVSPSKSGAAVTGDAARWPVVAQAGGWTTLRMDSVRTPSGVVAGRFCADLDDDLFTPGDTVEFYFSARDADGVVTYWTEFVGVTLSEAEARQAAMEMTCLPANAVHTDGDILYVDDADGHGAQWYLDTAFEALGMAGEVDRFDVRGPDRLAGNGPGSRVVDVAGQLVPFYRRIVWCSGNLPYGLVGDGTGQPEKSPDAQMIADFLRLQSAKGGVYLSGDCVAGELADLSGAAELRSFINYSITSRDHTTMFGISPLVVGEDGSLFAEGSALDTLVAYGGCPVIRAFDVIDAQGVAKVEASYHGSGSIGGAVVAQRTTNDAGYRRGVVLSGFSFDRIRDVPGPIPARFKHLQHILTWLQDPVIGPCKPHLIRLQRVEDGVMVRWSVDTNCYGFDAFRVFRIVEDDTTLLGETAGDGRELLDDDPMVGVRVGYRVEGYDESANWEEIGFGQIFVTVIIRDFAASAVDLGIELSWRTSSSTGFLGFVMYRETEGNPDLVRLHEGYLGPSIRRYLDRTVVPGTTYQYYMDVIYDEFGALAGGSASATARPSLILTQNSPNPFRPGTVIGYAIPAATYVELLVFDVAGRRVATLVDGVVSPAGYHEVAWDGSSDAGREVPSGVYFYRMTAAGKTFTQKMVIVR